MAGGLQVWNAAGQLVFNTEDRLTRILGKYVFPTPSGRLYIPEFANPGTRIPWFTVMRFNAPLTGDVATYANPSVWLGQPSPPGYLNWSSQGKPWSDARHCMVIWGDY